MTFSHVTVKLVMNYLDIFIPSTIVNCGVQLGHEEKPA